MKVVLTLVLSLLVAGLSAVPALRVKKTVTLTDGTRIEVTFCGDETYSYYLSSDGFVVEPDADGVHYVKTGLKAAEAVAAHAPRRAPLRIGLQSTAPIRSIGSPKIPVVLVNFSDYRFSVADNDADVKRFYELYCNGTGTGENYTDAGSYGAVKDYFLAQSDSLFAPEFTIIGPVTLSKSITYYGANKGNSKDVNYSVFRDEVIQLAVTEGGVSWSDFDNDGNGTVDIVFFVFAGLGESSGGASYTLWPKESTASTTINGIVFASSGCGQELLPESYDSEGNVTETKPVGIGVICHELSHALGIPDFYDTKSVAFGMDIWSLMDYGCYCNNTYAPVGYTAYERDFMGWRPLETLAGPCTVRLRATEAGGKGLKIVSAANPNEYYVVENRNLYGWDSFLAQRFGHGMMLTHVDYSATAWSTNTVNTTATHQRMSIIPANNRLIPIIQVGSSATVAEYFAALAGHLFPGTSYNTSLADDTTPAATLFSGGFMNQPLMDIREADGWVTFKFCPLGTLSTPDVENVGDIEVEPYRFTARWNSVPDAETYALELYRRTAPDTYELLFRLDSLSGTSKTISGLDEQQTYAYRVQAQADAYLDSPQSAYREVSTLRDGLCAAQVLADPRLVTVYTLRGERLLTAFEHELSSRLPAGVYVIQASPLREGKKIYIGK